MCDYFSSLPNTRNLSQKIKKKDENEKKNIREMCVSHWKNLSRISGAGKKVNISFWTE
jgi:hypothetical protein